MINGSLRHGIVSPRERSVQKLTRAVLLGLAGCLIPIAQAAAAEQISLLSILAEWRYPNATLQGAQMADGETTDRNGKRTTQSIVGKCLMTTDASIEKVLEFYRLRLKAGPAEDIDEPKLLGDTDKSVVFSDDSAGRPFAIHTVIVNTKATSTVLVVTRGEHELQTHIAWKHYRRIEAAGSP